ncbi:hypothetical protein F5141DRAFT_1065157 [Pisolithus sp. B1]|nr:hypothetical protein F5141DRAFT_1065157 [Pisolithus sp. B1]
MSQNLQTCKIWKSALPSGELYQTSLPWDTQIVARISSTSLIVSKSDTERKVQKRIWMESLHFGGVSEFTPPGNPLTPSDHRERSSTLINLADHLYERVKWESAMMDLDEVTTPWRTTLELTPSDQLEPPSALVILTDRLEERFRASSSLVEQKDSISFRGAASELTSPRHSDHLSSRVDPAGERLSGEDATSDLEQTIMFRRTALECTPPDHLDRPTTLVNLAHCFH